METSRSSEKFNNEFLKHYKENGISPVRQNIANLERHFALRKSLHRTLGVLPSIFRGKRVVEVGPGSGYNSLYLASLQPAELVLVEPNPTGVSHIEKLFDDYQMMAPNISVRNVFLEEFSSDHHFDVVVCEGLLPGIAEKRDFLQKLNVLLAPDGVLIVTTADEVSMFYEIVRYFLAQKLTANIPTFQDKIQVMLEVFSSHLDTLKGFGRLKEDWCADSLLGKAVYHYDISIKDCIQYLSADLHFYQSSPAVLTDYAWFKEQELDAASYNLKFCEQFEHIHHNFFHYKSSPTERAAAENRLLAEHCANFLKAMHRCFHENAGDEDVLHFICKIQSNLKGVFHDIDQSLAEIVDIIAGKKYSPNQLQGKYLSFEAAFGRGQQYVSFVKV